MTQIPLLTAQPHRNQQLFSDYYLNHLLPQRADWHALVPEARTTLKRIAAIVAGYTPSTNEAQTEDGLIKPVLRRARPYHRSAGVARHARRHQEA